MSKQLSDVVEIQSNVIVLDRVQRVSRPIGNVYNNQIRFKFDIIYKDASVVEIESDYLIRFFQEKEDEDPVLSLAGVENGLLVDLADNLSPERYEELKREIFESVKAMHREFSDIFISSIRVNVNNSVAIYKVIEENDTSIATVLGEILADKAE